MSKNRADGNFSSGFIANHASAAVSTQRDATHYNMDNKYRGIALIFNHEKFDKTLKLDDRTGTDHDAQSMNQMLTNLGFYVKMKINNTLSTLKYNINRAANFNHKIYDCFLVVVLTHGGRQDKLYAYDKIYSCEDLWTSFTADKCPSLAGKPKLFIIQACRGKKFMPAVTLQGIKADHGSTTIYPQEYLYSSYKIPSHADFLFAYSSIPGYVSMRDMSKGTWFIQALCQELKTNAYNYDILSLLTFVIRRVAIDYGGYLTGHPDEQKQIPSVTTTLTRLVQFKEKMFFSKTKEASEASQELDR